jgi:casein kinase II subunit beta
MLPIGLHDVPQKSVVKLFCPKCEDVYNAPNRTDGCYFGTSFPNMFFLEFPELKPSSPDEGYVPRVFGFKLHETSHAKSLDAKLQNKSKD